ncbi:MAG: hypothetical protein J2O46_03185 [Nocardioides sp.]|nr:hypothetical protein [Nocardioides sp.]
MLEPEDPITPQDHCRIIGEHLADEKQRLSRVAESAAETAASAPEGAIGDPFRRVGRRIEAITPGLTEAMDLLQQASGIAAAGTLTDEEADRAEALLDEARAKFQQAVRRGLLQE